MAVDYTTLAAQISAYVALNPKHGRGRIAAALGVPENEVRKAQGKRLARGLNPAVRGAALAYRDILIPENGTTAAVEPVVSITDPNILVMSDLHVPHHHRTMLARAIYITRNHYPHIRQMAIIGDLFDFAGISRHPKNAPSDPIESELRIAGDVLRTLLQHLDRIYICSGNHDERLARKLDAHLGLQFLIDGCLGRNRSDCDVIVSNLDYLHIDPADGDPDKRWSIGHPSEYSGQGGKTPSDIADIERRHIMTAHNHTIGIAASKSGEYVGMDIGHMTEPGRHYYKHRRLTKMRKWTAGFAVISNGYPSPFWERFTSWSCLGCE